MREDKPSNQERLEHMLEAISLLKQFTDGFTPEMFERDNRTYSACLFQFAILGEAVVHFDSAIILKYNYPWYKVKSFRNFILHEYHAVDARVVWDTIHYVLPDLEILLITILYNEFNITKKI